MLDDGRLGKLLHIEGNFCGPSAYRFGRDHWRQSRAENPAGGMTGRGVHVIDAMLFLSGQIDSVHAQSFRLAQKAGVDDTTSLLLKFRNGATGYLGTIITTAETWRMQVFGSKGWVEVGDVEHLTTWQMKVCYVDPQNLNTQKPQRRDLSRDQHRARRARELRRCDQSQTPPCGRRRRRSARRGRARSHPQVGEIEENREGRGGQKDSRKEKNFREEKDREETTKKIKLAADERIPRSKSKDISHREHEKTNNEYYSYRVVINNISFSVFSVFSVA